MPNMSDLAATALLVKQRIPLPETTTRSVEVQSWRDEKSEVSIHMEQDVTVDELVAIAEAIKPEKLWTLGSTAASMTYGRIPDSEHGVTVYFPPELMDELSAAANILIED